MRHELQGNDSPEIGARFSDCRAASKFCLAPRSVIVLRRLTPCGTTTSLPSCYSTPTAAAAVITTTTTITYRLSPLDGKGRVMSKPLIDLPSSISADGWADDLFKAAGTRPDPSVKAPKLPVAGPSSSTSTVQPRAQTSIGEYKRTPEEVKPADANGRGHSTEYSAQTIPAGGLAATLSYPGHRSFSEAEEDGRLKVCLSSYYL